MQQNIQKYGAMDALARSLYAQIFNTLPGAKEDKLYILCCIRAYLEKDITALEGAGIEKNK
ncbi:hypothetical protein EZS27_006063 [termite gut metagenome]|uniref:Uncharacterized protein n=1 Tax=termite gut metagenome TaxID=433724 RepID=A0A5J4SM42_9ZZZZ